MKRVRRNFATAPSFPSARIFQTTPKSNEHPYGKEWSTISAMVKKRDGYRCRAADLGLPKCSAVYPPPFQHLLHAHHLIPYVQCRSHDLRNLFSLCSDCHSKTHKRTLANAITLKQKLAAAKFR